MVDFKINHVDKFEVNSGTSIIKRIVNQPKFYEANCVQVKNQWVALTAGYQVSQGSIFDRLYLHLCCTYYLFELMAILI